MWRWVLIVSFIYVLFIETWEIDEYEGLFGLFAIEKVRNVDKNVMSRTINHVIHKSML